MKLFSKSFRCLFTAVLAVVCLLSFAPQGGAQISPSLPVIFPLTNATTFTIAGGATNCATAALTLINSQPFPVYAGRGFAVNISAVGTNSATSSVIPYFQFATPNYSNGVLVTNWSSAYTPGTTLTLNGTTKVFAWGLIPPLTVDHVAYGRLAVVSNGHSASILLDPTNTFISVRPYLPVAQ